LIGLWLVCIPALGGFSMVMYPAIKRGNGYGAAVPILLFGSVYGAILVRSTWNYVRDRRETSANNEGTRSEE